MPSKPKKRQRARSGPRSDEDRKKDPNLISRADAARLRGVSRAAVTLACRAGGPLFPAVRGKFVELPHAATQAWLAGDGGTSTPDLRELLARKRLAEVERLESRNARDDGRLISRELVQRHVFGFLQQLCLRLLGSAKTIAIRSRSALTLEEAVQVVQSVIGSEVHGCKQRAQKTIDASKAGDNPAEVRESQVDSREDIAARAQRKLAARLHERAPAIAATTFDAAWRTFARAAGGDRFDPKVFEIVNAARADIEDELLQQITIMLRGQINGAAAARTEDADDDER